MLNLKDSSQRTQATDPKGSFIVQAPAGSGKTEILTQRFLRLLSRVNAPEQIVALTFTRKAASEMRQRITQALQKVAAGEKALSDHQQQTFDYAAQALARSKELGWNIINQCSRFRIITIDALCQMLSQAIPLHDKQIPYAQIIDDPTAHYRKAAHACFSYALSDKNLQPALKFLLAHLDNRQDKLLDLLSAMLANRDQWLPNLYSARELDKTHYEQTLNLIEKHELTRFQNTVPLALGEELCLLAQQVATLEAKPNSPRASLTKWIKFNSIDRNIAFGLASLLLTSENKLRKSFDHHVGLKRDACEPQSYNNLKSKSKELLEKLDLQTGFLEALLRVKSLPLPHYDPEQWQVLQALFSLLPYLVGHLHLIFSEQDEVDFAAIAQQALDALGEEDEPTDLALYLDNTIQHLLIDEFQDTSIQQFQLLTKLVQGWQPEDGRTLFVVGDPMQSIYRFRQAEVGLFLKAKEKGIGTVTLTNLELSCNFRSTANLIAWINQQFKTIFPPCDDIESGAISFHPSTPVQGLSNDSGIKAWQLPNRQQEAQALVKLAIEELQNYPDDQVAILVRSRNQLADIMKELRAHQIPFQGVEIEHLAKLPHLRDLWSLTEALLLPANRLSWLALLRSPFCGLGLGDLHLIAHFDKRKSLYYALSKLDQIDHLSEEGRLRAHFFYTIMQEAISQRYQQTFVDWIIATFQRLQGELIFDAAQQQDLEQFWRLLERFTQTGIEPDLKLLKNDFDKLYSQRSTPSRLQIMTIHKSKGLEFDCVILPGLGTKPQNKEQPLLRWLKLPSQLYGELLLVAPVKAAYREKCSVYDYLAKLDAEKDSYELQRLLYVAATRAKKRLFLFDNGERELLGSFRNLLKANDFMEPHLEGAGAESKFQQNLPALYHLPIDCYTVPLSSLQKPQPSVFYHNNLTRQIGIVAHELLQWIGDYHPEKLADLPWQLIENRFKFLGFSEKELEDSCSLLRKQLNRMFNDPIGQWLIKAHREEQNEYELLLNAEGQASTKIIDRTFISEGFRWVIDFKTGGDEEDKQNLHRLQVNNYAELLTSLSSEPIRCGLYYLASGSWVQWDYIKVDQSNESRKNFTRDTIAD